MTTEDAPPAAVSTFDAFVSYSHAADRGLAPAVRYGLQRLAKPWYRRRALAVYLDRTGLEVTPELWSTIARALDSSTYLVLMASPQASASPWVDREIRHWLANRSVTHILPVVTSGDWVWDPVSGDLDHQRSTAAPAALHGVFREEPGYLDLRWATKTDQLDLRSPRFRDAIAQLAAPIHGRPKSELDGEDLRQHRRTRRVIWAAVAALLVLLIAATVSAIAATRSAASERVQRDLAVSRQLAAEATNRLPNDPQLATLLSLAAAKSAGTEEADSGLLRAVEHDKHIEGFLTSGGGPSRAAAFSPDQKMLATGAIDGTVRLWNVATRTVVRELSASDVIGLAWSGDGTTVVTQSDRGGVQMWDAATGGHRADLGPAPTSMSAAGRYVVAGYTDGRVQSWDVSTGATVGLFSPGVGPVAEVAVSPDGYLVAAAGLGGATVVLDSETKAQRARLDSPDRAGALAFTPDGSRLSSAGLDGHLLVWDARTGAVTDLPGTGNLLALSFPFPDVVIGATYDGPIELWNVNGRTSPMVFPSPTSQIVGVAISSDGHIATAGFDGRIVLWRLGQNFAEQVRGGGAPPMIAADRAGRIWASADTVTGHVTVADSSDPSTTSTLTVPGQVEALAVNPAGTEIAVGQQDMSVLVLDRATATLRATLTAPAGGAPVSLDYAPDGSRLAAGFADGTIAVWVISAVDRPQVIPTKLNLNFGSDTPIVHVAFGSDGRTIAYSTIDGVVIHDIDAASGKGAEVRRLRTPSGYPVTALAFAPDGTLAVGAQDGSVSLWAPGTTGAARAVLVGQEGTVAGVAFSPDGVTVAAVGGKGSVVLWNAASGVRRAKLERTGALFDVAFAGHDLYVVGPLVGLFRYDLHPDDWRSRLCSLVGRDLTAQEWATYLGADRPQMPLCE